MKRIIYAVLFIGTTFFSCTSSKESNADQDSVTMVNEATDHSDPFVLEKYLVTRVNSLFKVETITEPCAVFIFPSDTTVERLQKEYGEDFYTIADDVNWYNYESNRLLDTLQVKTYSLKSVMLLFKQEDGSNYLIDGNVKDDLYPNLFFFHPNKKPKVISVVGLEPDSVKAYFEIR